jgi:hypothetical protein
VQRGDLAAQLVRHRLALRLVASKISSRKVLPAASNRTATYCGSCSLSSLSSMLMTPYTAPVGSPRELLSGGSAWNARYR